MHGKPDPFVQTDIYILDGANNEREDAALNSYNVHPFCKPAHTVLLHVLVQPNIALTIICAITGHTDYYPKP